MTSQYGRVSRYLGMAVRLAAALMVNSSLSNALSCDQPTEWQLGLDSRGRHLAKAAGISTSGDNQWYMTAQWRNRTDEWSTEDGVMAILHIISGWQYDAEGIRQKQLV
ncbi:hypothetical protein V8E54_010850 [Elaphomyces granulatus]